MRVIKISRQISPVIAINLGYGGIGVAYVMNKEGKPSFY